MRKLLLLSTALVIGFTSMVSAQTDSVRNHGFENWKGSGTNLIPTGWDTTGLRNQGYIVRLNALPLTYGNGTTRTVYPQTGNYYLALQNKQISSTSAALGTVKTDYPFTGRPNWFGMYIGYITSAAGKEFPGIAMSFTKWNTTTNKRDTIMKLGKGGILIWNISTGFVDPWQTVTIDLNGSTTGTSYYRSTATPDSAHIQLYSTIPYTGTTTTTLTIFDNLRFQSTQPTGIIATEKSSLSANSELFSSLYPNPVQQNATIKFALENSAFVNLTVMDVTGRVVSTLVNGIQAAGEYKVPFERGELPNGIYFYRLQVGDQVTTNKMILTK